MQWEWPGCSGSGQGAVGVVRYSGSGHRHTLVALERMLALGEAVREFNTSKVRSRYEEMSGTSERMRASITNSERYSGDRDGGVSACDAI